ncbi:MAG: hypothetical protein VW169_10375 [Rhodospirillaceae bacterium]|jgi:hypothetical protein
MEDDLRDHQRFALKMEQSIRAANREILHPVVDPLTGEKVLRVAVEVSKRRAKYLRLALQLGEAGEHHPSGDELQDAREDYQEARNAFSELMHTIERVYVNLPEHD